jgi:hypothetical protein
MGTGLTGYCSDRSAVSCPALSPSLPPSRKPSWPARRLISTIAAQRGADLELPARHATCQSRWLPRQRQLRRAGRDCPQEHTRRYQGDHKTTATPTGVNQRPATDGANHDRAGHAHARRTGRGRPRPLGAALAGHKILTGVGAFIVLSLIVYAADPHGTHPSPVPAATATATAASRPASTTPATVAAASPTTAYKPRFPPETLAGFRAFAATGDASQVHQISTSNEGLPSCPEPNIYVTINPALTGRTVEADLSAFFVQSGLINSQCQAFVYAYHSENDYQTHRNDGYTAGRLALTTGSDSQRSLEVDVGEVTSEINNLQTQFSFNF